SAPAPPPRSAPFPYTTLCRSLKLLCAHLQCATIPVRKYSACRSGHRVDIRILTERIAVGVKFRLSVHPRNDSTFHIKAQVVVLLIFRILNECQCTDNCDKRYCILQSQQGLHKIAIATQFQLAFEYAHVLELTDIIGRVCTGRKCAKDEYTGEEGQDRWIVEVVRQNFHVRPQHIPSICELLCEK